MAQSGGSSARRGAQAPLPPHAPPPNPHDPASLPYHWHDKQVGYQLCHSMVFHSQDFNITLPDLV